MSVYNVSTSKAGPAVEYPRSRVSQSAADIVRSRTWSKDITKNWNDAVPALESIADRVSRYLVYFCLTPDQLRVLLERFLGELSSAVEIHRDSVHAAIRGAPPPEAQSSLACLDTHILEKHLPRGHEQGRALAVDFAGCCLQVAAVTLKGEKSVEISARERVNLREDPSLPLGLMDRKATALQLFDRFCEAVQRTREEDPEGPGLHIGMSIGFPCEHRGLESATLLCWTKGFQTGRATNDGVEGMDVAALLNCALLRKKFCNRVKAAANDAAATLVASAYELPEKLPAVRMSLVVDAGVNVAYVQPDSESFGYLGCVLNCEIGGFDKSLPLNDVDLEVDFADDAGRGKQLLEKMCATSYLGEICRRLVVKVWQNEAPALAWVRYSMPWHACARLIQDDTEDRTTAGEILLELWEWETNPDERRTVQRLFEVVFDRAASLCAVAVVAIAQRTEKLQRAMGGLTCAISGALAGECTRFVAKLQEHLRTILGETADLICIHSVEDAALKGAAILAEHS